MKSYKKIIALCLAICMVCMLILTGCSDSKNGSGDSLKVLVNTTKDLNENAQAKKMKELYNGKLEWIHANGTEQINLLFASGDQGDIILGNILQDADVSKYSSTGIIIPLEDYITPEIMPNLTKVFEKIPTTKAISTFTDGHIYSLPRINTVEADYLESALFINKVWLDKLGLSVPKTTEELYTVLKAFKEKDPNGNGKADEIPMTFQDGSGFSFPEALLSCWGVATKHGNNEGFVTVQDGEVKFAPMMDEWKEMIKYYNRLHEEGLLDIEALTQKSEHFHSKVSATTSVVGMTWSKTNPFGNADEYIEIPPINAPGYDIVWRIHPGGLGIKNVFSVTSSCKDVEGAMRWIDNFYDPEVTLQNWYGEEGIVFNKDDAGMYHLNTSDEGLTASEFMGTYNLIGVNCPGVFYEENIGTLLEANDYWTAPIEGYKMYAEYIDDEPWPRPYYDKDVITRMSELRTDIISYVNKYKAKWIVGTGDVEAEWNEYIKGLENIGIKEYIDINQDAYDKFVNALAEDK